MLRRILLAGLLAAATVPFTTTPASAICVIYVPTGDLNHVLAEGPAIPDVGPYNCNFCPLAERAVEGVTDKYVARDLVNCWT